MISSNDKIYCNFEIPIPKDLKKNKETCFNADPLSSVLRFHVTEILFVIFF